MRSVRAFLAVIEKKKKGKSRVSLILMLIVILYRDCKSIFPTFSVKYNSALETARTVAFENRHTKIFIIRIV